MDFGTQDQLAGLVLIVQNAIVDLSLNVYGCRVVQNVTSPLLWLRLTRI